jgi:hypothetical protein
MESVMRPILREPLNHMITRSGSWVGVEGTALITPDAGTTFISNNKELN